MRVAVDVCFSYSGHPVFVILDFIVVVLFSGDQLFGVFVAFSCRDFYFWLIFKFVFK